MGSGERTKQRMVGTSRRSFIVTEGRNASWSSGKITEKLEKQNGFSYFLPICNLQEVCTQHLLPQHTIQAKSMLSDAGVEQAGRLQRLAVVGTLFVVTSLPPA